MPSNFNYLRYAHLFIIQICHISPSGGANADASLLSCVKLLVDAERGLTQALERSQPLIQPTRPTNKPPTKSVNNSGDINDNAVYHNDDDGDFIQSSISNTNLFSTPRNMEAVEVVLSLARTYASRTSAPPSGWDPSIPMLTFSTPNPLPHQLRGGALGAMQLNMAHHEKQEQNEKRIEEEEQKKKRREDEAVEAAALVAKNTKNSNSKRARAEDDARAQRRRQQRRASANTEQVRQTTTMNLSDSSSSSCDDSSDEEEDEGTD